MLLVERSAMASLKEKWLGEPGPTDVLAFPMDDQVPDEEPYILGDIVICPDVAREQAATSGDKVNDEVDLLLVHGFLHLLGYDHVKPQDARTMRHRERKILAEFHDTARAALRPGGPSELGDWWTIIVIGVLVVLSAVFAGAETAYSKLTRVRALHLEEEGKRCAKYLVSITEDPARYINPILLAMLATHVARHRDRGVARDQALPRSRVSGSRPS